MRERHHHRRARRRLHVLTALVAVVALLAAACSSGDTSAPDPAPTAVPTPQALQLRAQPLTGIRTSAPTVVGAVVVNATSSALPASFTLGDLPAGVSLSSVSPSPSAPQGGVGWSCAGTTCQLTDTAGGAAALAVGDGAQALISLVTTDTVDPSASVTLTLDGGAPQSVPLSLPDGQPPVGDSGLVVDLSGPSTVLVGSSTTFPVTVLNLSAGPAPAGTGVTVTAPSVDGVSASAAGDGWSCDGLSCTLSAPLPASAGAPPLEVTLTAAPGSTGGSGSLAVDASASLPAGTATASDSVAIAVRPPRSTGVSTRLSLAPASAPAGSQVSAEVSITPTGQGALSDPLSFQLDLPDGVTAGWDQVDEPGWTCSAEDRSCTATSPLTAGQPAVLAVPLVVAADAPRTTAHVRAVATVGTGDEARRQDPGSASLVIVPPPVPELRASMDASGGPTATTAAAAGAPLVFPVGQEQAMTITVTNEGTAPAPEGSSIHLVATPTSAQRLVGVGGAGWTCDAGAGDEVSPDRPLRCEQELAAPLAGGDSSTLPITVEATTGPEEVTWQVGADQDRGRTSDHLAATTVETVVDGPLLLAGVVSESPLYQGGSGAVSVVTTNLGTTTAQGALVVVTVPGDVTVEQVDGPGWTCLDTTFTGAAGNIACTLAGVVAPTTTAPPITLAVTPSDGVRSVTFGTWAAAPGQALVPARAAVRTTDLPVAGSLHVDAGQDLTVVTPQIGPDGTPQPAVVVLTGDADLASARSLAWSQLCTQPGAPGCAATEPAVTWLGVPAGSNPTTVTARFTAPSTTTPLDLTFQLTGEVGVEAITDTVVVHLVPASVAPPAAPPTPSTPAGSDGPSSPGTGPGGPTTTSTAPPAPTASIATAGTALQVPTEATGQLVGSGTGGGTLTYQWTQTSGPAATIQGSSATSPTLQFTAPLLQPDQDGEALTFELAVTDGTGATATATADVQVVWGDDGVQVTLAGGATDVVSTVGAPITITSSVASRGAPYTYSWSVDDLTLPPGTSTDGPTLEITAPDQPESGSATLEVTDSFGRQTSVSVPVVVSGLPAGQVPAAFCSAVAALGSGRPAQLTGAGVGVAVPAATLTGAGATPCSASTIATFSDASAILPGGVSLRSASGQLTVAGVELTSGTVTVPQAWELGGTALGPDGLLVPFVSSAALGAPDGALTGSGLPLVGLSGWTGTTTITFTGDPAPVAVLAATGSGPATGSTIQLGGTATSTATTLTMSGQGLTAIGSVDLPVTGGLSTDAPDGPTTYATTASLAQPTALGAGTTLAEAELSWTPAVASGPVTLQLGAGDAAVTLSGRATVTGTGTSLDFSAGAGQWAPATGVALDLVGSGAVSDDQLTLALTSAPEAPVTVGRDLALTAPAASVTASCPLDASSACAPQVELTATATSALFSTPVPLSGQAAFGSGAIDLTGGGATTTVSPMSVGGTSLTVGLQQGAAPTVTATGTTDLLGQTQAATLSFTSEATLAAAPIGSPAIATGWAVDAATALATTSTTTWSPPTGPLAGTAELALAPGLLYAAGPTQIPSSLGDGVLPADLTGALASTTFAATDDALAGPWTLDAPLASPWYVAGDSGAAMAVAIDTLTFTATATAIGVGGTGELVGQDLDGSPADPLPLTITAGALAAGPDGGVLTATLSAAGPWNDLLGADGLDASDISVAVGAGGGTSTATLTGQVTLPAALAGPLGIPATATPALTAAIGPEDACASIDLASGGAPGIDFGGAGLVVAQSAYLVVAPQGCTTSSVAVPSGMTLLIDGTYLGITQADGPASASLAVDPTTFAVDDTIDGVSATVAGLSLTDGTIDVSTTDGSVTLTVSGQAPVDGTPLTFTGTVALPGSPGQPGTLTLAADPGTLTIGGLSVDGASVAVSGLSVVGAGQGSVSVTGTTPIVGVDTAIDLTGALESGTVEQLAQTLPTATYVLWAPASGTGDTLAATFRISYDVTSDPALSIVATDATLQTPTQSFGGTTVEVTGPGTLGLTTTVPYLTDGLVTLPGGAVSGSYTYAGPDAGTYTLKNPSTLGGTLAGISQQADVDLARTATGAAETATQTSTLAPGAFDGGESLKVSGALSTTAPPVTGTNLLTPDGDAPAVTVRGLAGTLEADVQLSALSTSTARWYQIDTTLTTATGDCRMWQGDAELTGQIYGSGGTTYYTLTGSVTPKMPFGLGALTGPLPQPLLLTNEVLPGSPTPANAISLNYPISGSAYNASATLTFGLEDCSYGVGGSVDLILTGGASAQALAKSLTPPPGVSTSLNDLFGAAGQLPFNMQSERNHLQTEAMAATIQADAVAAQATAENAAAQQQVKQTVLDQAIAQQTAAQQEYETAKDAFLQALDQVGEASDAAEFANDFPLVENEIGDAQAALRSAAAQVVAAQADGRSAQTAVTVANQVVSDAQGELDTATDQSETAATAANTASQQAQSAATAKLLQVTLDLTYCSTCQQEFTGSIDGEAFLGPVLVAEIDANLAFFDDDDAVQVTVGVGPEWIFNESFGPVGVSIDAQAMISATFGWTTATGWDDLAFTLQASAQVDAWISTWFFTDNADLASISIYGQITALPSWSITGTYSFDVFDFSIDGSWSET